MWKSLGAHTERACSASRLPLYGTTKRQPGKQETGSFMAPPVKFDVLVIYLSPFLCVYIMYVCIYLYCVICLKLYYWSLLICTNKKFKNNFDDKIPPCLTSLNKKIERYTSSPYYIHIVCFGVHK